MSSAGINFGGIASGLDTNGIIDSLIQIESQNLNRIKANEDQAKNLQSAYSGLRSSISSFSSASNALNFVGAFNPVTAKSSDEKVATVSASSNSSAGSYSLKVNALAQAQKISTAAQTDTTSALNLSAGTFVVNGKAISVDSSDTLKSIAIKINDSAAGVTASLIDGGTGNAYMTLTSVDSGVANKVQLTDMSGTTLNALGLSTGVAGIREAISNGAQGIKFGSNTSTLESLLNTSGITSRNFSINGTSVSVDLTSDTLQTMADKINSAGISGVSATLVSSTTDDITSYRLKITGASTPTFSDPDGVLGAVGILSTTASHELVQAQDASYTLDNVALTSSSNTITTAIPGATLTLLKADHTTPADTATITMTKDNSAIKTKVQSFIDSYNSLNSLINDNSQLDEKTFETGVFFSDATARQVQSNLSTMLFNKIPGLTGKYTNLASIGFSIDQAGKLNLDSATFDNALTNYPDDVAAVFQATGKSSNSQISYVTSTSDSKSSSSPYAINITQAATKGSYTAGIAQTTANTLAEKLTFNGSMFSNSAYVLNLDVGSTASSIVNKVNTDSKLKNLVFASLDGSGKLNFQSKVFGSNGNFTVASNYSASSSNSGIGPGGGGTTVSGLDVAGTINGEAATGSGQFLTGKSGNKNTDGIQILYTGTATGNVGTLSYSQGISLLSVGAANSFTDSTIGALTAADKSLQTQIDSYEADIVAEQARIDQKRTDLKLKFSNMEAAVSAAQRQGQQLAALK